MPEHADIELFIQDAHEAAEKAKALRACGLKVETHEFAGGYALAVSGPPQAMEEVYREVAAERRTQHGRALTGTVRWWKDEKGYGRITGDDGYIYFCHFSALQMEGSKTLRPGQRVEFLRIDGTAAHGRAGAANVRVLE